MRKIIACIIFACMLTGIAVCAEGKEVTALEAEASGEAKEKAGAAGITEIQGVVDIVGDIPDEDAMPEEEWVHTEPEDCTGHEWEYSYESGESFDIVYFRFCLNCGATEYLDKCPEELEGALGEEEPIEGEMPEEG